MIQVIRYDYLKRLARSKGLVLNKYKNKPIIHVYRDEDKIYEATSYAQCKEFLEGYGNV